MKLSKGFHNTFCCICFASFLLSSGSSARIEHSSQTSGHAVSGLQLTVHLDRAESMQSKAPKFKIEIHNVGDSDLILNLGITLANGKKQYPNAIVLAITDPQGETRRFTLREPAFVAGRMDPLILPIPVDASFSIPVDLDKYWVAASGEFDYKFKPGTYSLEAQFTGKGVSQREANLDVQGIALMPYWTGAVTSNQQQFKVENQY
jgi:hypothetical protein